MASVDKNKPVIVGKWVCKGETYRLVRSNMHRAAKLFLEILKKDSLGNESWRQIDNTYIESAEEAPEMLHHLLAIWELKK